MHNDITEPFNQPWDFMLSKQVMSLLLRLTGQFCYLKLNVISMIQKATRCLPRQVEFQPKHLAEGRLYHFSMSRVQVLSKSVFSLLGGRTPTLESDAWIQVLAFKIINYVTLGMLLNFPVPQFPSPSKPRNNNSTYLIGCYENKMR